MSASQFTQRVVVYLFYALTFLVPLVWSPLTSELFEFNKMVLVYLGSSLILVIWSLKSIEEKKFSVKRTPLDLPILLFLMASILSTIFSIDWHTSVFGYYSRLNGGLLSTFSYIVLFYAFVTFFDRESLIKLLKILVFSSLIVAIYAILQHPNPFFRDSEGAFRGIDAGYWRQNSQARVFSTLGQPNWLAAFLAMVTPFAIFLLVKANKLREKFAYTLILISYFLAFTFTYSRGGTLGFLAMIIILVVGSLFFIFRKNSGFIISLDRLKPPSVGFFIVIILIGWILIFALFGNAFTSRGIDLNAITSREDTQLASYGDETGKIRLIVWEGGLDIFKNFPLVGSGVETFAYSYYLFKPTQHNLTVEWDFLYNKAHNEFVNYLSTTGTLGFVTYLLIIVTFLVYVLRKLRLEKNKMIKLFYIVALSSYVGYHVQNFFGFSVVITALLFFLIPGFVFVYSESNRPQYLKLKFLNVIIFKNMAKLFVFIVGIALLIGILVMWVADYYYATGISTQDLEKSYQDLKFASALRPDEPLYKVSLGLTTVSMGAVLKESDSKARVQEGFDYLNQATSSAPNNITLLQTRMEAIYGLAIIDKRYAPQVLETAKKLAELAPTSANQQYNLAVAYLLVDDLEKAQKQLEKVVAMRFSYKTAWMTLLRVDEELGSNQSLIKHQEQYDEIFDE